MFEKSSGEVVKRFWVRIDAAWHGNEITLDEHFEYADGLIDEQTLLNRTTMSKLGFKVGEVTLAFRRR